MSIRLIAREMYRLMRESEKVAEQLEKAPLSERTRLEAQLREVTSELAAMRRAMAGALDKKT